MKYLTTVERKSIIHTPEDSRCLAIMQRFGDKARVIATWSPAKLFSIAKAVRRSASVPSLVMMIKTYSSEVIEALLQAHVTSCIVNSGLSDKFAPEDYSTIAKLICENEKLRTLNMAFLLSFFARFQQGEFELYGYTPNSFLRALQQYYVSAKAAQEEVIAEEQKRQKEEEYAKHQDEAINWQQFAKEKGLDPSSSPIDLLLNNL